MTNDDLKHLQEGRGFLRRAAATAPIRRRAALNKMAAKHILPRIGALPGRNAYDILLEDAARAGAVQIIKALPVYTEKGMANLVEPAWEDVAANLPPEAYGEVEQRGLFFGWEAIVSLLNHGPGEVRAHVRDVLSKTAWRLGESSGAALQHWCKLDCSDTAAAFMKAQVETFPDRAQALHDNAVSYRDRTGTYLSALMLECMLERDQDTSLSILLRNDNASAHERLALSALCKDPVQIHRALRAIARPHSLNKTVAMRMLNAVRPS